MSYQPKSLITQYLEGSIVGRQLRDMLATEAESERFEKELTRMDVDTYGENWEFNRDYGSKNK